MTRNQVLGNKFVGAFCGGGLSSTQSTAGILTNLAVCEERLASYAAFFIISDMRTGTDNWNF